MYRVIYILLNIHYYNFKTSNTIISLIISIPTSQTDLPIMNRWLRYEIKVVEL